MSGTDFLRKLAEQNAELRRVVEQLESRVEQLEARADTAAANRRKALGEAIRAEEIFLSLDGQKSMLAKRNKS